MTLRISHAADLDAPSMGRLFVLAGDRQTDGEAHNELLRDALHEPFKGLGKPEPLLFGLAGCWSRRINREDRLVYLRDVQGAALIVLQCRYHY